MRASPPRWSYPKSTSAVFYNSSRILTAMDIANALAKLDAYYQAMPPVAAMHLRIAHYDAQHLKLHAPLAHHVNDKGCAFGGSLVSMMTLAGWGLVAARVREAGIDAEIFVADTQVRYLAPLFDDLVAEARLAEGETWDVFLATLRERGRGRVEVDATVPLPDGRPATTARSRYVAIAK